MLENKRMYKRFDLPLIVKFRPALGSTSYSLGLTKNLSCEGISMEARGFNFVPKQDIELELKLPQNAASVSLLGNVVWKRQDGKTSYAGVAFNMQDKQSHMETMKKITSYTNIPLVSALYSSEGNKEMEPSGRKAPLQEQVAAKHVSTRDINAKKDVASDKRQVSSLTKQYRNEGTDCLVSFFLPREAAPEAERIALVGDFNNWDTNASLMQQNEAGDFFLNIELSSGREYKFKYFIDGFRWENDWHADKYVPNAFGSDDSVVVV